MIKVNETQKKEKTGERHPLRAVVFFAFSLLFLLYYAVMILWGGGRSSMAWIWPCAAVLMFGLGIVVLLFGRIPYESPIVVVAVILALSLILTFVFVEAVIISHMSDQAPDGVECIIVLGAAVKGTRPSSALYNRIVTAAEYLHNNPDTVAVLSGGQGTGEDISEAECMRRELVRMGIDESRLILEDESTDTAENMDNSMALIGDKYESIAVVTNNFHVYRALRLARARTDRTVYAISAPFDTPLIIHFMVREFVGLCHDTLDGNL